MRYDKLLDGLEIQEILYSKLEFTRRMDSEYYKKIYTDYEDKIYQRANDKLKNKANFLIGPFGSAYDTSNYTEVLGYRYVRGQDVKPFVLKDTEPRYMTKEDYERLKKYALKPQDILVSVVGTLGNACIVKESDVPAIFSCKSTVIRVNDVNPYYLIAYLNSRYGRALLLRKERGAIQKGLNLDDLKELDVPLFSDSLYMAVQNMLTESEVYIEQSKSAYAQAEYLMEKELGFDSYVDPKEVYSVKNFSEVFGVSDRIDAEYYQEKYDRLESILHSYDPKCELLGNVAEYLFTGEYAEEYFNKDTDTRFFIRGTDIKNGYVEADENYCIYPNQYTKFVKTGDIITGRVGTIGNFGVIDNSLDNSLCSDNILCFHLPERYTPAVYALYFNLPCVDEMITRLARGSVQQRLNQETLKMVEIPFIPEKKQLVMKAMVEESRSKQILAQELLNQAVHLVEIAIEQGEEEALKCGECGTACDKR